MDEPTYDPLDTFEIDMRDGTMFCQACGATLCNVDGFTVRQLIDEATAHRCA